MDDIYDVSWMLEAAKDDRKKAHLAVILSMAAVGEVTAKAPGYTERVFHYRDVVKQIQESVHERENKAR